MKVQDSIERLFRKPLSDLDDEEVWLWTVQYCFAQAGYYRNVSKRLRRVIEIEFRLRGLSLPFTLRAARLKAARLRAAK